jgi:hypothetical protein
MVIVNYGFADLGLMGTEEVVVQGSGLDVWYVERRRWLTQGGGLNGAAKEGDGLGKAPVSLS